MNYEKTISNIREQLKNYITENHIQSLVMGISGGLDSCTTAILARPVCDELGIPLIGRSLPIRSNEESELHRAILIGSTMCTNFKEDRIIEVYYDRMSFELNSSPNVDDGDDRLKKWKIRNGNIKARLRMVYLYNLASENNGMVLSTDNYTEYMLGFWTLHGDVGDFGMIQELWKSEVYDIAEWIMENESLPAEAKEGIRLTLEADATDGLGITNTSLNQILPDWTRNSREGYKEVDRILQLWESQHLLDSTQKTILAVGYLTHPVIQRHLNSQFKRNNPYNLKRNLIIE